MGIMENDNPNANRGRDIIGASITLIVLPTLAVALRLLSRWISRAGLWVNEMNFIFEIKPY